LLGQKNLKKNKTLKQKQKQNLKGFVFWKVFFVLKNFKNKTFTRVRRVFTV